MTDRIATRFQGVLDRAQTFAGSLELVPSNKSRAELKSLLHRELERHALEGWVGLQLLDDNNSPIASTELLGHVHTGQGYASCELCAADHHLVLRDSRPSDHVLLQLGEASLDPDASIESTIELSHHRALSISIVTAEGLSSPGLRTAVLTQLAATGAFIVVFLSAFLLIRRARANEIELEELALKDRIVTQQRTAHMDRLATMAASVAHELASPLTYVTDSIYLALQICREKNDDAELLELLEDGDTGCNKVRTILNDMRTFSHPGAASDAFITLDDVVAAAARMSNARLKYVGKLDIELEQLPKLRGNPSRLGQVFLNLFINAADAMAEAPEKPALGHCVRVRAAVNNELGVLRITVQDTGSGIQKEHRDQIFESLFTTKPIGEGTGLGLPICREIIRDHGGELALDSNDGGACFVITLPLGVIEDEQIEPHRTRGTVPLIDLDEEVAA